MSSSLSTTECRVKWRVEILDNQKTPFGVRDVIVTPLADRNAFIEIIAIVERLPKLLNVGFAVELDVERPAHQAIAAVATDHVCGTHRGRRVIAGLDLRRDRVLILSERHELAAVAHGDARQRLRDRLQQRLERVLRNELIGLERLRAVFGLGDPRLRLRHGRMHMVHQRRLDQRQHDEDVHRAMSGKAGGANPLRDAHAAVDLHGAGVATLHLRKKLRRLLLLDHHAAHAAPPKIDGERQAGRARPDNENLGVHA